MKMRVNVQGDGAFVMVIPDLSAAAVEEILKRLAEPTDEVGAMVRWVRETAASPTNQQLTPRT